MQRPRGRHSIAAMIAASIIGFGAASADADPVTIPGYTAVDLGIGMPTFSTNAQGRGIVTGSAGQSYPFTPTADTAMASTGVQGPLATFPNAKKTAMRVLSE